MSVSSSIIKLCSRIIAEKAKIWSVAQSRGTECLVEFINGEMTKWYELPSLAMHRVRSVCFRVRPNWIDPFGINFKYHKRIVAIYRLSHLQGRREKTYFEKFKRTWNLIVILSSSEFRFHLPLAFVWKLQKLRVLPRTFGFRKLTSEFAKHPKVHNLW